jgi:hypothetical protein
MRKVPFRVYPLERDLEGEWGSVGFRSLTCVLVIESDVCCVVRLSQACEKSCWWRWLA